MRTKGIWVLLVAMVVSSHGAFAQSRGRTEGAQAPSSWFVRMGVLAAIYHSSAEIATSGLTIPGATATVSNNTTLMFDLGYDVTKAFSIHVMGGIPPKPTVTAKGAVAFLGDLGAVRYGPMVFTGVYHMPRVRGWRPYVGAGGVYAIILHEHDGAVSDLIALNNWGFALQVGVERALRDNLDLFVDVKEAWLAIDAHGTLGGGVPVTARVALDPSVVSLGVKVRFR